MKRKILVLLVIVIFFSGCSYFENLRVEGLNSALNPNKNLRFRVRQLAISLDRSLKFLKIKQDKIVVENFKPLNGESKLLGIYLKEKLKEELFKLGYLISTNNDGKVKVSGFYVDRGKKFEIMASIEGEGIKLSEASVLVDRKYIENSSFYSKGESFLTSER